MKLFHQWGLGLFLASLGALTCSAEPPPTGPAGVVRRAGLDASVPLFIPVHPRIATTVTFPRSIGEPMGTGFVDADTYERAAGEGKGLSRRGEYVISYLQGDTFFTVQPLQKTDLLNLNVPFEGATIVLFFYVVDHPLSAVASLIFDENAEQERASVQSPESLSKPSNAGGSIQRMDALPTSPFIPATPARLEGFLRKLRLVHAAKRGPELADVCEAMRLKVAVSSAEDPDSKVITHPRSDGGAFELVLLRAVRDPALDAVGFVVLVHNKAPRELVFDVRTFAARCGAALYQARVVDAPAQLRSGEVRPAYFAIVGAEDGRPAHLAPDNDWRLSVSLAPRTDGPAKNAAPEEDAP